MDASDSFLTRWDRIDAGVAVMGVLVVVVVVAVVVVLDLLAGCSLPLQVTRDSSKKSVGFETLFELRVVRGVGAELGSAVVVVVVLEVAGQDGDLQVDEVSLSSVSEPWWELPLRWGE